MGGKTPLEQWTAVLARLGFQGENVVWDRGKRNVGKSQTFDQVTIMKISLTVLNQMIDWLTDCVWGDVDEDWIRMEATEKEICEAVERHYEGGISQFLKDGGFESLEGEMINPKSLQKNMAVSSASFAVFAAYRKAIAKLNKERVALETRLKALRLKDRPKSIKARLGRWEREAELARAIETLERRIARLWSGQRRMWSVRQVEHYDWMQAIGHGDPTRLITLEDVREDRQKLYLS